MYQSLEALAPPHCICYEPVDEQYCVCNAMEKALRCYLYKTTMPPMTPAQREECLEEIGRVEGYDPKDYAQLTDRDLARSVLHAWADYCRDKGLL